MLDVFCRFMLECVQLRVILCLQHKDMPPLRNRGVALFFLIAFEHQIFDWRYENLCHPLHPVTIYGIVLM